MSVVGYARVSSVGQSLEVQRERLKAAGVEKLFEEKRSGLDAKRPALQRCLEYVREGDTLLVTKVDRMARSAGDFHAILRELADKGVGFKALDDAEADTTTRSGKLLLGILALIAEFESDIRKERQADGIARAKREDAAAGKPSRFGRKRELTTAKVTEIVGMRETMTVPQIMKATGLAKASVYRALAAGAG